MARRANIVGNQYLWRSHVWWCAVCYTCAPIRSDRQPALHCRGRNSRL